MTLAHASESLASPVKYSTQPLPAFPDASTVDELAIRHLSDDNQQLEARIVSLESAVATYRELTNAAVDALHDLTAQHKRLRDQHHQVQAEYRALRERILLNADVAA